MTTGAPNPPNPPYPTPSARSRPSRLRRFLPLGLAAWVVLEIWLLIVVAEAAGGFTVFLLLLAGVVGGAVVMKSAGRRAFRNLSEALQKAQRGENPETVARGEGNGLVMLAGLLLIIPGMISDAVGLVLLVPPVRKAIGRYSEKALEKRMRAASPGSLGDAFQQARIHRPDGKVVQGEVIRDDEPSEPPPPTGPRPPLQP
ncbi:FxsA family membrane protein [Streptomyces sp. NPDC091292]|uniref:FxsA family membrane protein n=1 Tax=Streptomyces sp. NPDC091292 TaxID=3365991 RepID=UPI003819B9E2